MERRLEEDENLDLWHDKLTMKMRVLMTSWTAQAWKELEFFRKLFQKTVCLITADGSDDH